MFRPIVILNLPEAVRTKLQSLGYEYVEDIERALASPEKMSVQLKSIISEHNIPEKIPSQKVPWKVMSGSSLRDYELSNPPLSLFHRDVHLLLDGGLHLGKITELCGLPGSGKTQFCLQFCIDVQIPPFLGGVGAEALYISTDFGFTVKRLAEIAEGSVRHLASFEAAIEREDFSEQVNVNTLLNGVHVLQIHGLDAIVDTLKNLPGFLEDNPKVKLVVIDSFSQPLVAGVEDLLFRSKVTAGMMDTLLDHALKYKFAVVLTNQYGVMVSQNQAALKPYLGEGFAHRVHQRLTLQNGFVCLRKSMRLSPRRGSFKITKDGIR